MEDPMTTKKTTPTAKSAGKSAKKNAKTNTKTNARRKTESSAGSTLPAKKMTVASGVDSSFDEEPAHGRVNDASDLARDRRFRKDLEEDSGRSPTDRHRERLTAVEAEEDDVRDDDDEPAADQREAAISEQEADDDRA
jgi:hypothetical protein